MRIAVVDGFSNARYLVEELARRGVDCVHLRTEANFRESYVRGFDPAAYAVDLGHVPDLDEAAAALQALGADLVIAGAESGVVVADTLSSMLGRPGNEIASVRARRDKFAMAQCLRAAGLAAPIGVLAASPDEAATWYGDRDGRVVVVKPLASAATDGVRVCRSAAAVREATAEVIGRPDCFGAMNHSVLVQDYLEGDEFIVNTVTRDGTHKVVDIWQCIKNLGPHGSPVYDYHRPVARRDPVGEDVVAYTKQAVTALGILNGAGHSEVMLTASGPVLIETGARLMGSTLPWVHEKFSGTSHVRLLALALTDPARFMDFPDDDVRWSRPMRQVYLVNDRAGVCRSDGWKDAFRSLDSFVALNVPIRPGDVVPQTVDLATVPGYVYLAAESAEVLERDHTHLRRLERTGIYTT